MKILVNFIRMMIAFLKVIPGTHVISDSENDNGSDEQQEKEKHWIGKCQIHFSCKI
jgi:hypothetical protein